MKSRKSKPWPSASKFKRVRIAAKLKHYDSAISTWDRAKESAMRRRKRFRIHLTANLRNNARILVGLMPMREPCLPCVRKASSFELLRRQRATRRRVVTPHISIRMCWTAIRLLQNCDRYPSARTSQALSLLRVRHLPDVIPPPVIISMQHSHVLTRQCTLPPRCPSNWIFTFRKKP